MWLVHALFERGFVSGVRQRGLGDELELSSRRGRAAHANTT